VSESDRPPHLFNKSIVLVVDALKYEFAKTSEDGGSGDEKDTHYRFVSARLCSRAASCNCTLPCIGPIHRHSSEVA
jgi:hypothetical protein